MPREIDEKIITQLLLIANPANPANPAVMN
jgi:hypothetical protein